LASQGTKIKITFLLRFVIFLQALKAKRASLRRIDVSPPSGGLAILGMNSHIQGRE
jgi:hypothetical protein